MIYLIHGQNQVDSRRFLIRQKTNYRNIETVAGKYLTSESLRKILVQASRSLFGGKNAVVVEGFRGDWKPLPKKVPEDLDLFLWSSEKIKIDRADVKSLLFEDRKSVV